MIRIEKKWISISFQRQKKNLFWSWKWTNLNSGMFETHTHTHSYICHVFFLSAKILIQFCHCLDQLVNVCVCVYVEESTQPSNQFQSQAEPWNVVVWSWWWWWWYRMYWILDQFAWIELKNNNCSWTQQQQRGIFNFWTHLFQFNLFIHF